MNPAHLQLVDGEIPADGPQSMAEALHHIRMLEGEVERLEDEVEGVTRSWRASKGEERKLRRLLEDKRRKEEREPIVRSILENWRDTCSLSPKQVKIVEGSKRWERVVARLDEGWTLDELLQVPQGALTSSWHNGTHPKANGKRYLEVDTIFRDSEQVEKFVRLAREQADRDLDARVAKALEENVPAMAEALRQEREADRFEELLGPVYARPSEVRAAQVEAERFEGGGREADAA